MWHRELTRRWTRPTRPGRSRRPGDHQENQENGLLFASVDKRVRAAVEGAAAVVK
jgi:hypothetical protein